LLVVGVSGVGGGIDRTGDGIVSFGLLEDVPVLVCTVVEGEADNGVSFLGSERSQVEYGVGCHVGQEIPSVDKEAGHP